MADELTTVPSWLDWLANPRRQGLGPPGPGAQATMDVLQHIGSLPRRAFEDVGTQTFHGREPDIGTVLEATTLPMGGTAFSGARGALGAGPTKAWFESRKYQPGEIKSGMTGTGSGTSPLPKGVDPKTAEALSAIEKSLSKDPLMGPGPYKWETFFTPNEVALMKSHYGEEAMNKPMSMFDADELLVKAKYAQKGSPTPAPQAPSPFKPKLGSAGPFPGEPNYWHNWFTKPEIEAIESLVGKDKAITMQKADEILKSVTGKESLIKEPPEPSYGPGAAESVARRKADPHDPFNVPRETPFKIPERGTAEGYTTAAVHGTRKPPYNPKTGDWEWPKRLQEDFGGFKLPDTEIGVHYGGPRGAGNFTTFSHGDDYPGFPRKFPVALRANNPLEMRDLGSWGPEKVSLELERLGFPRDEIMKARKTGYPVASSNEQIKGLRNYIESKGYDSIKYINKVEDPGHTSYIMFKSAENDPRYAQGVRVPWAKFDPSKKGSSDILSSIAGALGLGGLAAGKYRKND